MTNSQRVLRKILVTADPVSLVEMPLSARELGFVFVDAAFLKTALDFLSDELWLAKKNSSDTKVDYLSFLAQRFQVELGPLSYLEDLFSSVSQNDYKKVMSRAETLEEQVLSLIKSKPWSDQKEFASQALALMDVIFKLETDLQNKKKSLGTHLGMSVYRTFDGLDEVFNLNYQADVGMKVSLTGTERLYEGAGVGVQSGYSTVLTALRYLSPSSGMRIVDLGSGYGRVGIVVGLMRPDLDFIGYEYVPHRVEISSTCAERLGLQERVHFYTQDLSLKDFQIPEADIYYLYDPFSEETYGHVLSQLVAISRHRKITIATKGNARGWLMEVVRREGWAHPQELDSGNLCLFHSSL